MSISVIIPCFNLGNYVSQAIESVLDQTIPADEIIVVDDASTDNSRDTINLYKDKGHIRAIFNEANKGLIETFNIGVRSSTSSHFIVLSADDWMTTDFIEKHLETMQAKPDCAIYYCDFIVFGPRAASFAEKNNLEETKDGYLLSFPEPTQEVLSNLPERNVLHGSSVCSRYWFDKVGGYQKSEYPEDLDFGMRILKQGAQVAHVPHALLHYRQHSISQTQSQRLNHETIEDYKKVVAEQADHIERLIASEVHLNQSVDERDATIAQLQRDIDFANLFAQITGYHSISQAKQQHEDRPIRYRLFRFLAFGPRKILHLYDLCVKPRQKHRT